MDLLDYLDLDKAQKKYDRVRSWYMYEQYKTLERNQHDAAQRLKSKSCQDRILHQELSERRVRRRLCDQFDTCRSESQYDTCKEAQFSKTVLVDDAFINLCELETDNDFFDNDIYNKADYSESAEINGDIGDQDTEEKNEEFGDIIEQEHELTDTNISENVNSQVLAVQENNEFLDEYTKAAGDVSPAPILVYGPGNFDHCELSRKDKNALYCDTSVLVMWSRLVTFAYQIIKLNHGSNCYFNYSSQFLASVIMLDVVRRVPYVSPIKFEASESDISIQALNGKQKNIRNLKINITHRETVNSHNRKVSTERDYAVKQNNLKFQRAPCTHFHNTYKYFTQNPEEYSRAKFRCNCRCWKHVLNRILQLSRIIDDILEEVTD